MRASNLFAPEAGAAALLRVYQQNVERA
jgi:hypothetical protein